MKIDMYVRVIFTAIGAVLATTSVLAGASPATSAQGSKNTNTIQAAKTAVKNILKDPESVRFSNVRKNSDGDVCGEYNAKNSYGGYGEPSYFMYQTSTKTLVNATVMGIKKEIGRIELITKNVYVASMEDMIEGMYKKKELLELKIVARDMN